MKRGLKRFLITIMVIILAIVLVLGYLGLLPGVSAIFGSDKPRDLGITVTEADLQSSLDKLGQTISGSAKDVTQAAGAAVDVKLSQEEFAAHVEQLHPVTDVQIKLTGDGSFEASGLVDKSRIDPYLSVWGISPAERTAALETVNKWVPGNPPFYFRGSAGSINNGQVAVELDKVEIGRLSISPEWGEEGLAAFVKVLLANTPGFSVDTMIITTDGELAFRGSAITEVPLY